MSIGRTIHESLQKALASTETGLTGFDEVMIEGVPNKASVTKAISQQTPDRLRTIAQAMRHGLSNDEIHAVTMFDPWFLARIREIIDAEEEVRKNGLPSDTNKMRQLKMLGFTDARLTKLTGICETDIRNTRQDLGVNAVFKRIDTCAAEFEAQTPYMYSTYESPMMGDIECEAWPSDKNKIVILADEVYQENVYQKEHPFLSTRFC